MSDNKPTGPTGNEFHDKAIAEIWALFKESEIRQREAEARQKEVDAQITKMSKEIAKLTRKLSKDEGQWGKIAEALVGGELITIIKERFGIILDDVALRMKGEYNDRPWEIDVIGVNSNVVVIVEVKTTLDTSHMKEFIRSIVNRFPKLVKRHRKSKVYAGVAYVRTSSSEAKVIKNAEDNGLFVIKVINNTNKIVNSPDFRLHDHQTKRSNVAE